jgi:tetratricopeptide (TPR) repeat protein
MKNNKCLLFMLICFCLTGVVTTPSAAEKIPGKAHRVLTEISTLLLNRQYEKAVRQLESFQNQALEKSRQSRKGGHHHYLITFALGNSYLGANRLEDAAEAYQLVLKEQSDYVPAGSNLGKTWYQLGRFEQAAETFSRAYEMSKKQEPRLLYLAAVSLLSAGLPASALGKMQLLAREHPEAIRRSEQETQVRILFALNQNREALPVIQEIISASSGVRLKTWREILLHQYTALNMRQPALRFAEELITEEPLEPIWWRGLASVHLSDKNHEKALMAMTVARQLQPLTTEEKKLVASLNLFLDIPVQSARLYEGLPLSEMTPETVKALVHSYLKLDDIKAAQKWLEIGVQRHQDKDLLYLKANLHFEQEQFKAAGRSYEQLVLSYPEMGQAWLMWGYSAWMHGETATARRALTRASTFNEQKSYARAILKQMDNH